MARATTPHEIKLACKMYSEGIAVDKICENINRDRKWFYRNTKGLRLSRNHKAEKAIKLREDGCMWKDLYKIVGYKSAESAQAAVRQYKISRGMK